MLQDAPTHRLTIIHVRKLAYEFAGVNLADSSYYLLSWNQDKFAEKEWLDSL